VHATPVIDSQRFVETVTPLVERREIPSLIHTVQRNWTLSQVAHLLECKCDDARKLSALVLGLIGTGSCIDQLSRQLHHADPMVQQMAEHAMWSIWIRSGNEQANGHLASGMSLLEKKDVDGAIKAFSRAIAADLDFAEAYNQRAMAYYLREQFEQALADCRAAVKLCPMHFGAWAGLGHCHGALGEAGKAIECYQRARQINPQMECLDELISALETRK
jgi:tetratricopeptide (TPR) repeat protein